MAEPKWYIYGHERLNRNAVLAEYSMTLCACGYEALRQNELASSCGDDEHTRERCVSEEYGEITLAEVEQ